MKKFLLLALFFVSINTLNAQTDWYQIGGNIFTGDISSQFNDLKICPSTGEIYAATAKQGAVTGSTTVVVKWNGSTWEQVGNADFIFFNNLMDIKIAFVGTKPCVAVRRSSTPNRIYIFELVGSTWQIMGGVPYFETNSNSDFSFKSFDDILTLSFNNTNTGFGITGYVCYEINSSSYSQRGGLISDSYIGYGDHVEADGDIYSVNEYGDMTNFIQITKENGAGDYGYVENIINEFTGGMKMNYDESTSSLRIFFLEDDAGLYNLKFVHYNLMTSTASPIYNIANNVIDFDIASTETTNYVIYRQSTSSFIIKSINSAGSIVEMANHSPTGVISRLKIDYWNDRIVALYRVTEGSSSFSRVIEYNNDATFIEGAPFSVCSGTALTSPNPIVVVNDNNYYNDIEIVVNSSNEAVIPNASLNVIGTYPNYFIEFTANPVSTNTLVNISINLYEHGNNIDGSGIDVTVIGSQALINLPFTEICRNHGIVNLNPFGSPSGGIWSGPGVSDNKLNTNSLSPGNYNLTYKFYTPEGCLQQASQVITILPVPNVNLSVTNASCGTNNGAVNSTITGGTPSYTIYWSNGASTANINSLSPGMYYINVTDSKGCQSVKPANVQSNDITVNGTTNNVTCFGGNDGSIDLNITTGLTIASILWSNGATTEDISDLSAGIYDVVITATNGCVTSASFEITSPDNIEISSVTTPSNCGGATGSIDVTITGGTEPYDYSWFYASSGISVGSTEDLTNIAMGQYNLVLSDDNGCTKIFNVVVSEIGSPEVVVSSVTPASCLNDGAITTSISSTNPITSIEWSNGLTTQNITDLSPGYYSVIVQDDLGCSGMTGVNLPSLNPEIIPICVVTVDTSTNTNLVVWEKPITSDITHFNIYRESSVVGVYNLIASVPYSDESLYNDIVASPQIRSWRYKISSVNTCGVESELSDIHKTIHLTISLGLGGTINLNWDNYEGFSFTTFDLYRYTNTTGWVLVEDLPSNSFSYTDTPPNTLGLDYILSIEPPAICTSTKAQDHNASRSNKTSAITGNTFNQIIDFNQDEVQIEIFPNPSSGIYNIIFNKNEQFENVEIVVRDVSGKIILTKNNLNQSTVLDLTQFENGIYIVEVIFNENIYNKKIIKQD